MKKMTEKELKQLLDSTYELEGLLTLALSRTGAPERVHKLIESKAYAIADQAASVACCQEESLKSEEIIDKAQEAASIEFEESEDADIPEPKPEPKRKPEAAPSAALREEARSSQREEAMDANLRGESASPKHSKALRNCFSLNDKFLFRRELFGGNDADFNTALDKLAALNTLSEGEDFLYNELQFDPDSDAVKSFIGILENYYA